MSACMDTELIQPRLATDLYRPQALAVKREADGSMFRQEVLVRAANCVRSNPNILAWMFLSSKNEEDFVFLEESRAHVLEDGTRYGEVTMTVPVVAGSKRKR
jgi:hypothetical protein